MGRCSLIPWGRAENWCHLVEVREKYWSGVCYERLLSIENFIYLDSDYGLYYIGKSAKNGKVLILVFSFYCGASKDQTLATRVGGKCLQLLSHIAGLLHIFLTTWSSSVLWEPKQVDCLLMAGHASRCLHFVRLLAHFQKSASFQLQHILRQKLILFIHPMLQNKWFNYSQGHFDFYQDYTLIIQL